MGVYMGLCQGWMLIVKNTSFGATWPVKAEGILPSILKDMTQECIQMWIVSWCGTTNMGGQPNDEEVSLWHKQKTNPSMCPTCHIVKINSPGPKKH